jgi:hypothetical protein
MEDTTPTISTGEPSTLKTYRKIAEFLFPKALPMLDERIAAYGEDEVVVQHESQMLYLFGEIQFNGAPEHPAVTFTEEEGFIV